MNEFFYQIVKLFTDWPDSLNTIYVSGKFKFRLIHLCDLLFVQRPRSGWFIFYRALWCGWLWLGLREIPEKAPVRFGSVDVQMNRMNLFSWITIVLFSIGTCHYKKKVVNRTAKVSICPIRPGITEELNRRSFGVRLEFGGWEGVPSIPTILLARLPKIISFEIPKILTKYLSHGMVHKGSL